MKRLSLIFVLLALACGCARQTEFETLSDTLQYDSCEPSEMIFQLPEYVSMPVFADNSGNQIYICDDYSIETYIMPAGDLKKTVSEITGFDIKKVSMLETITDGIKRYDCSWSTAGEVALQTCRATIYDDGNYHYVLAVIGDQNAASKHSEQWKQIFKSYIIKNTD